MDYEAKQEQRRQRLLDLAQQATADSNMTYTRARRMGDAIPFGQPILVGHHSEKGDRRYRARMNGTYEKAFALSNKAEHYAAKAASVGKGGISSDDPKATDKLRAELANAEKMQEAMKRGNVCIRKNDRAGLAALGFDAARIEQLFTKDFAGRIGFPSYQLTNNNANIRRIKMRIADLEKHSAREAVEVKTETYTYREDTDENRVMFLFDGKPDAATRTLLKSHAFNWSPSREGQPWVRQLNGNGIYAAQCVRKVLDAK